MAWWRGMVEEEQCGMVGRRLQQQAAAVKQQKPSQQVRLSILLHPDHQALGGTIDPRMGFAITPTVLS